MDLKKAIALSIGSLIVDKVNSFTPDELSRDVAARLKKPKEDVLRDVIEYCTDLIWIGIIGSTTSVLYTKADTPLVIWWKKPFFPLAAEVLRERAVATQ